MSFIDDSKIESLLQGVVIPSRPAVLTALMEELRKPMANGKRVALLIREDPGLAAGVLKSANSPLFGGGRKIGAVADAIRLLGFGTVLNLVVEVLLRRSIATTDASLARFWDSSLYAATIGAEVAGMLGGTARDTAYTFGLLHDCGIPLLVQRYPNYKDVLAIANDDAERSFTAVEDAAVGTNHAAVGYFLAKSWGLPTSVCKAVMCHHDYTVLTEPAGLDDEARSLVAINLIATYVGGVCLRTNQDAEWPKGREAVAAYLGYSPSELDDFAEDLIDKLESRMADAAV